MNSHLYCLNRLSTSLAPSTLPDLLAELSAFDESHGCYRYSDQEAMSLLLSREEFKAFSFKQEELDACFSLEEKTLFLQQPSKAQEKELFLLKKQKMKAYSLSRSKKMFTYCRTLLSRDAKGALSEASIGRAEHLLSYAACAMFPEESFHTFAVPCVQRLQSNIPRFVEPQKQSKLDEWAAILSADEEERNFLIKLAQIVHSGIPEIVTKLKRSIDWLSEERVLRRLLTQAELNVISNSRALESTPLLASQEPKVSSHPSDEETMKAAESASAAIPMSAAP